MDNTQTLNLLYKHGIDLINEYEDLTGKLLGDCPMLEKLEDSFFEAVDSKDLVEVKKRIQALRELVESVSN